MSSPLAGRRVLVTGGAGFLGRHVVDRLRSRGVDHIVVPRRGDCDLTDSGSTFDVFARARPEIVIHLAARVGGIGANHLNPGLFFRDNMAMGLNVVEACRRIGAEKLVMISTTCAYPKFTAVPFKEDDLWKGYPEETTAPYGVAKRALAVMLDAYRSQYGLRSVYLIPPNLYGPLDNFDLESGHVIPGLIRKFEEARQEASPVVVWGTGNASREFLYVEDAAEGIVLAAERYDKPDPVNLGSGVEVTIRDLARMIQSLVGHQGEVLWDPSRPDGQPRRCLDVTRAEREFGFRAATPLAQGIRRTIEWYRQHQAGGSGDVR